MEKVIISVTVGYMLKVLKSGCRITKYRKEFKSIRHGNYIKFIESVNAPIGFIVSYDNGFIKSGFPPSKDDLDFELLLKAGPSLKLFYLRCTDFYGVIKDPNFEDEIFENLAAFEISLRMHANNSKLLTDKEDLVDVINKLGKHHNLLKEDIRKIQLGRDFLNKVKHKSARIINWDDEYETFQIACKILERNHLTII